MKCRGIPPNVVADPEGRQGSRKRVFAEIAPTTSGGSPGLSPPLEPLSAAPGAPGGPQRMGGAPLPFGALGAL